MAFSYRDVGRFDVPALIVRERCSFGPDAVDHLLGDAIDLVLLDCVLPDGPNWQVALEADRQNIPVVFMTGDPGQAKELVGGARPYLLKPFGLATLIDVIDSNARQKSGDSEPGAMPDDAEMQAIVHQLCVSEMT